MKRPLQLILVFILTIVLATAPALAASTAKTLKAYYGVQILYNNQILSSAQQPFIVDGTTYIPLRMLMDAFGDKQIAWDAPRNQVIINSGTSQAEAMYIEQILTRNTKISDLENQVKTLKDQMAIMDEKAKDVNLNTLENNLNNDYEDYNDFEIDITLSGDNEDVSLKIDLDSVDWDSLTTSKKESFLQRICDDIWDKAKDADVSGSVKDGSTTLTRFQVKPNADVTIDDWDIDKLEDDLNDDYGDYRNLDFSFSLSGDRDNVSLTVDIDETDWNDLSSTTQESLLNNVCDDIWDKAEYANIRIRIKDGSTTIDTINLDPNEDVDL